MNKTNEWIFNVVEVKLDIRSICLHGKNVSLFANIQVKLANKFHNLIYNLSVPISFMTKALL